MEERKNTSERLVDAVGDWVETYRNLITMRIVEHASQGASVSILGILSAVVVVFLLLFLGLGSACWVVKAMKNIKLVFLSLEAFMRSSSLSFWPWLKKY